jgi:hypothetical protein
MATRSRPFTHCLALLSVLAALLALCAARPGRAYDNRIFMDPAVKVVSTEAESLFTVEVARNQGDFVAGFEVEVTFDNTIVELLAVTPGVWITLPGFPYFFYDHTTTGTDRIHFTEAFLGQLACYRSGPLAVCHFRALQEGISPLTFTLVKARSATNAPIAFTPSTADRIVIESAVPVETTTFGRIKELYRR